MRAFRLHVSDSYRAIVLATTLVVSVTACQSNSGAPDPTGLPAGPTEAVPIETGAAASSDHAAVRLILDDLKAAARQHDARAFHHFRDRLAGLIGVATVYDADAAYRQVLADLIQATALHDAPSRARFRAQLRDLCDPAGLTSAIESCAKDVAAYGG